MTVRRAQLPDDLATIRELADATGLTERKTMDLEADRPIGLGFVAGEPIAAYLHMHPHPNHWAAEIAGLPRGHLEALIGAASAAVAPDAVRLWTSNGDLSDQLEAIGYTTDRELHQMRRVLPPDSLPDLPNSVSVHPFRTGLDETSWLEVNNRAFAGHPENGNWTISDLLERMKQPWFDQHGLLVAWEGGRIIGSCWTKRHSGTDHGEIYVIGVDPSVAGRGLGTSLTLVGLWDLYERQGAKTAVLYVDAGNSRAMELYHDLGFETHSVNRSFEIV